jgi:hypothetical protein
MRQRNKVFLSGGLNSNWQSKVMDSINNDFIFFNPRDHKLDDPDFYTTWDIHFVKDCDIFFGYMESNNPSGFGLAFELGLAYALNKTIILVDEKSELDATFAKYFKILYKPSGIVVSNLDEGIDYLKKFSI